MRAFHSFLMGVYGLCLRLFSLLGHSKAKGWMDMRRKSGLALKVATDKLPAGERWHLFHCASVGEFEQARPVMEAYREAHPNARFLLTFFSPSGWNAFQSRAPEWWMPTDFVAPSPLDTPRQVEQFLAASTRTTHDSPSIAWMALAKYEVWPNWIAALQRKKIPCAVFAAHAVEGRWPFRFGGGWYRKVWSRLDAIWVQHAESLATLQRWGISKASIAGDPRFDRVLQTVQDAVKNPDDGLNGWVGQRLCVVVGSAWEPEMIAMLAVDWPKNTCVIIVPHEWTNDSIQTHQKMWQKKGSRAIVWNDYRKDDAAAALPEADVLLVDAMGFLTGIYAVANIAVLGGGFGAGIHNVLEPAAHGVPIWVGPNCSRFLEAQLLGSQGGLEVVNSEASLTLAIEEVLANPAELRRIGLQAQSFVKANAGAADCIADGLSHL